MKKKIVIALGGNALLQRGEILSAENQQRSIQVFAEMASELARDYQLVIVHGNGPQVGLLALQNAAYKESPAWPLDSQLASSPYWGLQQRSFADAAGLLQQLAASPLPMPRPTAPYWPKPPAWCWPMNRTARANSGWTYPSLVEPERRFLELRGKRLACVTRSLFIGVSYSRNAVPVSVVAQAQQFEGAADGQGAFVVPPHKGG